MPGRDHGGRRGRSGRADPGRNGSGGRAGQRPREHHEQDDGAGGQPHRPRRDPLSRPPADPQLHEGMMTLGSGSSGVLAERPTRHERSEGRSGRL